jgi:hypothetical protein
LPFDDEAFDVVFAVFIKINRRHKLIEKNDT